MRLDHLLSREKSEARDRGAKPEVELRGARESEEDRAKRGREKSGEEPRAGKESQQGN